MSKKSPAASIDATNQEAEKMDQERMDVDQSQPVGQEENSEETCQSRSRKRDRSGCDNLPPHNTDCDCSTSASDGDDDVTLEISPKKARTDEASMSQPRDEPQYLAQTRSRRRETVQERRSRLDLRPEVLRSLSPRTLHRTLMSSVNLEDFSFSDSSSSSINISLDELEFNYTPRWSGTRRNASPPPVEYEIGSISPSRENPNPIEDMMSSTDDGLVNELQSRQYSSSSSSHWSAKGEAERGSFADSSDSESDVASKRSGLSTDSELSDQDRWRCSQCDAKTNPYFRHCLRCFNLRRNWLPPRPKNKGKTRPPIKVHRQRIRATYTYPPEEEPGSIPCSTPDDERQTSHSSKGVSTSTRSTTPSSLVGGNTETDPIPGPSRELSLKLQTTLDAPPVSVAVAPNPRDEPLCIICMGREKNAAFVHGKSAHFCCCYHCGDKILKRAGKCPVCRKRILRVVKIIS